MEAEREGDHIVQQVGHALYKNCACVGVVLVYSVYNSLLVGSTNLPFRNECLRPASTSVDQKMQKNNKKASGD